ILETVIWGVSLLPHGRAISAYLLTLGDLSAHGIRSWILTMATAKSATPSLIHPARPRNLNIRRIFSVPFPTFQTFEVILRKGRYRAGRFFCRTLSTFADLQRRGIRSCSAPFHSDTGHR